MFSLEQVISPLEMRYVAISLWAKFHFTSVAFFFPPLYLAKKIQKIVCLVQRVGFICWFVFFKFEVIDKTSF